MKKYIDRDGMLLQNNIHGDVLLYDTKKSHKVNKQNLEKLIFLQLEGMVSVIGHVVTEDNFINMHGKQLSLAFGSGYRRYLRYLSKKLPEVCV